MRAAKRFANWCPAMFLFDQTDYDLTRRTIKKKTYLKYGGLENCTCDQAGFFYECEMQRQGTRQQVLKNGAQSAGYLWPGKFFPAHLLFVLNVFFFSKKRRRIKRLYNIGCNWVIVKSIVCLRVSYKFYWVKQVMETRTEIKSTS